MMREMACVQQRRYPGRRTDLSPGECIWPVWLAIFWRVDAQDYASVLRSVDGQLPDRDADLEGEVGEVVEFCQFRRLRDLRGRTRFQPDLEVDVGEVVEGERVQGVEGERTGMRFKSDLERAA